MERGQGLVLTQASAQPEKRGVFAHLVTWAHLLLALLAALGAGLAVAAASPSTPDTPRMSFLDNGVIRIGVDLRHGGSIGYLADAKKRENIVNIHDGGRWIGQSYYAGPRPFGKVHPAWKDWPWNPVSAGDVYGHSARVLAHDNDGKVLHVKSIPLQWALDNVPAECTFETWITLDGPAARVRNRLTNRRTDRTLYRALDQELPAVYTTGKLHRLFTYDGDRPFAGAALREVPRRPPRGGRPAWSTFLATEHWAALVDDAGWGLGVYHPGAVRFLGGFWGKSNTGGPHDDPTGYLAPVRREVLDHNIVYEYEYVLILGQLPAIRRYVRTHRSKTDCPNYHFVRDRQHWYAAHAADCGCTAGTGWRVRVEGDDPQLIGPETFWAARDVPKLYLRAAYHTKQATAELFWQTIDAPTFDPKRRVTFAVKPDGRFHTYPIDLASAPGYRGAITGLRFDPVPSGAPGEYVEIASLSACPPVKK